METLRGTMKYALSFRVASYEFRVASCGFAKVTRNLYLVTIMAFILLTFNLNIYFVSLIEYEPKANKN